MTLRQVKFIGKPPSISSQTADNCDYSYAKICHAICDDDIRFIHCIHTESLAGVYYARGAILKLCVSVKLIPPVDKKCF